MNEEILNCYLRPTTVEMIMSEVALLEKISEIFIDDISNNLMLVSGKCQICKKETILEVVKTSGGFGINGGIFQVTDQKVLNIVCVDCYKKF
jgi:hypothetical protein